MGGARSPAAAAAHVLDALIAALLRESQVQSLLWSSRTSIGSTAETQALLDRLVDSLPATRVLLLVDYRPEYEHRWGSKTYYSQLRLDPLPLRGREALLTALLGDAAGLASMKRLTHRPHRWESLLPGGDRPHAGGDGCLAGDRGAYHLGHGATGHDPGARDGAIRPGGPHRPARRPRTSNSSRPPPSSGRTYGSAFCRRSARRMRRRCAGGLAHLQGAEFVYEASSLPRS